MDWVTAKIFLKMLDVNKLTFICAQTDTSSTAVSVEFMHKTPSQSTLLVVRLPASAPAPATVRWLHVVIVELMSTNVVKFACRQTFYFKNTN